MAKVLSIDTTKSNAYINLNIDGALQSVILKDKVSESLLPSIERLLSNNNLKISEIDTFGVVVGPGSFTGIRVGLSTIKGFLFGTCANCVTVNSFEVFDNVIDNGVLLIKSTNSTMYYGTFSKGQLTDIGLVNNTEIVERFGDIQKYQLQDEMLFDGSVQLNNYSQYFNDAILRKIDKNDFVDAATIEPLYVQLSQAESQLLNRGVK